MAAKITHGHTRNGTRTRTYAIWNSMINRCRYPIARYGDRGIRVCERWKVFEAFLEDVGEIPPGLSIDRIDANGNYEPGNIRLATAKEQARNRKDNRIVTIDGMSKTASEWEQEQGIAKSTFRNRLKAGMTGRDLLAPGPAHRDRIIKFNGLALNVHQWARRLGLTSSALNNRLRRGWSIERALSTEGDARRS